MGLASRKRGLGRSVRLSRRGFLRLAGGTAGLATLANVRALPASAAAPAAGGRFLTPRETELLTRIAERMVETGEPGAPPLRKTRAIETIDALLAALDPAATRPLPALLRLVEWGPLLFEGRLARFSSLEPAEQDAHLAGWMTSRIGARRMGFLALRNLALLGYWSQDETWPLIGYAGPLLRQPRARPA